MSAPTTRRSVHRIVEPPPMHWVGDGFPVRSLFSYAFEPKAWSPFLLLDYMGPKLFTPTRDRRGVGPHPHRGFETVTVVFSGEVEHRDSAGNHGTIGAGDVQWMTAASGILHEEVQSRAFSEKGGLLHGAQIWVNLPAQHKMSAPRYQDLLAPRIPSVELGSGASARVVAGEIVGTRGPALTVTPVSLWDVALLAGASAELSLPEGHTALVLVVAGSLRIEATEVVEGRLAELSRTGSAFRLAAKDGSRALVLGGQPIDEPIVGQGPFVMNTWAEIIEAVHAVRSGEMGELRSSLRS